jgi:hypothetical protein
MRLRLIPSILLALPLLCSSAFAQGSYFLFGGGADFSMFNRDAPSGAVLPDQSFRPGFNALIGFQTPAGEAGATVLGIGYETRGAVWSIDPGNGQTIDATIKFNYIHLKFDYKYLGSQSGTAYIAPGVDLAFLTSSEAEIDDNTEDMKDVNSVDLDLGLAFGFQVPMNRNAFFMQAGYVYGLFNTVTGEGSDDFSAHNSCIKLTAGFLVGM